MKSKVEMINQLESAVKSDSIIAAIDELNREIDRLRLETSEEDVSDALILGYIMRIKEARARNVSNGWQESNGDSQA